LGVASDAWQFIRDLLSSPGASMLSETPRHADVAQEVFRSHPEVKGSVVFDAHTAILMKEHGVRRILTRDADFFRFPFLEVIDPLADEPGAVREARARYRHRPARRLSAAGKR
jgi:predicted nucleic acid-binding protein